MNPAQWRKSSYSQPNGNCVEVSRQGDHAAIRDTKDRKGGFLTAAPAQWVAFLNALKNNRYDE